MAYNLVLDTKFNPFTYDEMIKPVEAATKAHLALEEEYSNIAAKADILDRLANELTSPLAYRMYKGFSDDLNERADLLMRYGLNTLSRKLLLDMRARYSKEIAPIEAAYTRRELLADEQRKALALNPTLLFLRMASTMSLDDFIRNPSLDYGMSYSGALLTLLVANIAESLSREARRGEEGMRIVKLILPYLYKTIANTGFSSGAIMKAILDSPDADSILTGIVENVVNASGIKNWGDLYTINSAYNYARLGLYKAVGLTQYQILTDQYNMQNDLAAAAFLRLLNLQQQLEDEELYNGVKLSGISYLVGSGEYGKYLTALSGLKTGQDGVLAAYFGKHGTVNPVEVYEEFKTTMNSLEELHLRNLANAQSKVGQELTTAVNLANTAYRTARTQARLNILNKYGVTNIISNDLYNALKAIGYNGGTTTKFSQLIEPLDALALERLYYSTNMSGHDIPDLKIRTLLGNWESNGSFSTAVYKLNADGTLGEAVDYDDLKLANGSENPSRKVTGVYYSAYTPNKIIVLIGETGDRYLMDPNVLGSEVAALILGTANMILRYPNTDLTEASVSTTVALTRLLNSYNQTAPKSGKLE